jgi:hypothetical protein
LNPLGSRLLLEPDVEFPKELLLFQRRGRQHLRIPPDREQVQMNANQFLRMDGSQSRRDERAPIAALSGKPLIT